MGSTELNYLKKNIEIILIKHLCSLFTLIIKYFFYLLIKF